jgi:tetratricopeptide (TPR) repeat protein
MGDVYHAMKDFEKSIKMYEKELSIDPNYTYPNEKIVSILISLGEYQKAREHLKQYSELQSAYIPRWRQYRILACLHIAEGNLERSLQDMNKIDNLTKQESDSNRFIKNQFDISEILYEYERLDEAKEKLSVGQKLMEVSGLSAGAKKELWKRYLWHSTRLAIKEGKIDQARDYAEMYRNEAGKNEDPSVNFSLSGLIAYEEENYEKAISDLHQSNLDSPPYLIAIEDMSFNQYLLAKSYLENGDRTRAIEIFKTVIDYNSLVTPSSEIFRWKAKMELAKLGEGDQ